MKFHLRSVGASLFLLASACPLPGPGREGTESPTFLLVTPVDGRLQLVKQASPTERVVYIGVQFEPLRSVDGRLLGILTVCWPNADCNPPAPSGGPLPVPIPTRGLKIQLNPGPPGPPNVNMAVTYDPR